MSDAYDLRAKYTRFRILVIGRANAGKTTLLQRVCNTTEDPCIYDDNDKNLLEPTSARGIHDINRPFAFKSNPGFIFHDSPGFETGDERQLQKVLSFMKTKARSTEVDDQLHAIWSVSLSRRTYWPLRVRSAVKGFVLFWTMIGLYFHWKRSSLRRRGQGKVSITRSFRFSFQINIF